MKKSIIAVCLLTTLPTCKPLACISEGPTHNRYMFSVFHRDALDGPTYLADINSYWIDYCQGKIKQSYYEQFTNSFYANHSEEILKIAQAKGDNAMVTYLKLLNRYISVCDLFTTDGWHYPTKQEIAERKQKALAILAAAKAYRGSKLKQQYVLLQMRLNMILGYNIANANLWINTAKKFTKTCWRDAMQNIYARALYKSGKRLAACDQYAVSGDMASIKRVIGNYRSLAGIKTIYQQSPNSPSLNYLVQDFVNNVQETLDTKPEDTNDTEWFDLIDAKRIYRKEALEFVNFANTVGNDNKSKYPCLWLSAAAMVNYLLGNQQQAMNEAAKAINANGTPRMRDNARAIRMLITTRSSQLDEDYTAYLLGELRWLDSKIKTERHNPSVYDNHYSDVKDRVIHKGIEPLFAKSCKPLVALAVCDMMRKEENDYYRKVDNLDEREGYNRYQLMTHWPGDEVYVQMDSLTADQLLSYYKYITSTPSNALEQYVVTRTFKDEQYFNDLIGTKYMAEGRFSEAIPYLQDLTTEFMSNQAISIYEATRQYDIERWFHRQKTNDDWDFAKVTTNKKLKFCKEMLTLQSQASIAREGAPLEDIAYKLATRFYQASCYGDCWWLTHHYNSVSDSARSWEMDYAKEAIKYLTICKKSKDNAMRYHAIYALAFIPSDPWFTTTYDKNWNEVWLYRPESLQYKALQELSLFASSHPTLVDQYTTRCDVLEKFRKIGK